MEAKIQHVGEQNMDGLTQNANGPDLKVVPPVPSAPKKERTIRSETTKVFLVIFAILLTVGVFTIFASFRGASTFTNIREVYVQQFRATEVLKQRALEIIGIFYLLSTDQDINLLMEQMQRYDGLVGNFDEALKTLKETLATDPENPDLTKMTGYLDKTKIIFDNLNNTARLMTISFMEGKRAEGVKQLPEINKGIGEFKEQLDGFEKIVIDKLNYESDRAQSLLKKTTWMGIGISILAIFITLGLIYYLMKFLSISLLPISNLMHNMRQAVFSIDSKGSVISPVSKYSTAVFKEDIVGANIFDVAYRDIPTDSEMMAKTKSAIHAVFGEDELQWMLAEDELPKQVKRKFPAGASSDPNAVEEKILKLTYTPLWDKEQKLQNLMIVAEDVTEIEKLREEALKKQGEIGVIQALISMARKDVEPFLTEFQLRLVECRSLIGQLASSKESRQLLFRILHTLKGNARMYNFSALSEVIHFTENTVVEINKILDSGETLRQELLEKLADGLSQTDTSLAYHFKMAHKLFGIQDRYAGRSEEKLYQAITSLEVAALHKSTRSKLINYRHQTGGEKYARIEGFVDDVQTSIEAIKGSALYFESQELSDLATKLGQEVAIGNFNWIEKVPQVSTLFADLLIKSKYYKNYSTDLTKWISVYQRIYSLSDCFERLTKSSGDPQIHDEFEKELMGFFDLCDSERFLFLRFELAQIIAAFIEKQSNYTNLIESSIGVLWRYLAAVSNLDVLFSCDESQFKTIKAVTINMPTDLIGAKREIDQISTSKVLFLSFLRSMARKDISPKRVIDLGTKYLQAKNSSEFAELVLGKKLGQEKLTDMLQIVKTKGMGNQELGSVVAEIDQFGFRCLRSLVESHYSSGTLRVDLLQLMTAFLKVEEEEKENDQEMIEIPVHGFNVIKSQLNEIDLKDEKGLVDKIKNVRFTFMHLFDQPVKALCRKMGPMIKDLSKRLDKEIDFKISGDDIALNRDKAYSLRDALVHLIRNSLDHGIEPPEERQAVGKVPRANIEIICKQLQEGMELSIRDDGRGINVEKVVKKAVSNGIISQGDAERMSHEQKLALIFVPNLSTKEEVTNLSGRGVGMDAVKDAIEKMGGTVHVSSQMGKGTEIRLVLQGA